MTAPRLCLATQVLNITGEYTKELPGDEPTYLIGGLSYEVFTVGETLYLDVDRYLDRIPLSVLRIDGFGHSVDQAESGLMGLLTVSLTAESLPYGVMNWSEYLYRLEMITATPHLTPGQITFIPPHLV